MISELKALSSFSQSSPVFLCLENFGLEMLEKFTCRDMAKVTRPRRKSKRRATSSYVCRRPQYCWHQVQCVFSYHPSSLCTLKMLICTQYKNSNMKALSSRDYALHLIFVKPLTLPNATQISEIKVRVDPSAWFRSQRAGEHSHTSYVPLLRIHTQKDKNRYYGLR